MIDRELGLPVDRLGHRGEHDIVVRTDERRDVLGEQRRELGDVAARLEDVAAVVETDADDLLGPRDQRCEVEARDGPGHPTRALGALTPSLVAKELAHICGSDVDRRVAVHTDRTRAVTVSNRRKLHGGEYGTAGVVTSRLDIGA